MDRSRIRWPIMCLLTLAIAPAWALPRLAVAEEAHVEQGEASWYGPGFEGKPTASGETFDSDELTAAHPTLPLGSTARVTNLENGRSVKVEINDRGPAVDGRVIDLSHAAAKKLDMVEDGTAPVKVVVPDSGKRD